MKNLKWIGLTAVATLLLSACGSGGGNSAEPTGDTGTVARPGQAPVPPMRGDKENFENQYGELKISMDAIHARYLKVMNMSLAVQTELYKPGTDNFVPTGVIAIRANTAVTYKDGDLESEILNITSNTFVAPLHSKQITIIDTWTIDESVGEPTSVFMASVENNTKRANPNVISSPETEPHQTIFVPNNNTAGTNTNNNDDDVISSPDTEPSDSIFIPTNNGSYRKSNNDKGQVISSPETEPENSIFTTDNNIETSSEQTQKLDKIQSDTNRANNEVKSEWTWRGVSYLPIGDQISLDCITQKNRIMEAIFNELSAEEIAKSKDAIIDLKCIARKKPVHLYNHIVDTYSQSRQKAELVLSAVNSPVLAVVATKAYEDLGMRLLSRLSKNDLHTKFSDIKIALNYMKDKETYFSFPAEVKNKIFQQLTALLSSYESSRDDKYIMVPLAMILKEIGNDKKMLVSFAKELEKRDINNNHAKSLAKTILTLANQLTQKECKEYKLTNKQITAFVKVYGGKTYDRMITWMAKSGNKKAVAKNAARTCSILD